MRRAWLRAALWHARSGLHRNESPRASPRAYSRVLPSAGSCHERPTSISPFRRRFVVGVAMSGCECRHSADRGGDGGCLLDNNRPRRILAPPRLSPRIVTRQRRLRHAHRATIRQWDDRVRHWGGRRQPRHRRYLVPRARRRQRRERLPTHRRRLPSVSRVRAVRASTPRQCPVGCPSRIRGQRTVALVGLEPYAPGRFGCADVRLHQRSSRAGTAGWPP